MLDVWYAGEYNQAIMDFGSLQCKPKSPLCQECVLRLDCVAYTENLVAELPVKIRNNKIRDRYFHYLIIRQEEQVLMSQRSAGDIWENLYEFPLIETAGLVEPSELNENEDFLQHFPQAEVQPLGPVVRHLLSHQRIHARFYLLQPGPSGLVEEYNGEFPTDYHALLGLPGEERSTAAAIASFSTNQAYAVLDGNVFRVLSRYFGVSEPINTGKGKKLFSNLATEMLDVRYARGIQSGHHGFWFVAMQTQKPALSGMCVETGLCGL